MYLDPEEIIKIIDVIDCPSVELKLDVGDEMYKLVADYGLRHIEEDDYFKIGFHKMLTKALKQNPVDESTGQLFLDFDE